MVHQQPAVMIDDGSGNRVDRHNLRTAAWGGLIGTALEQYDFVIYGTATAIVYSQHIASLVRLREIVNFEVGAVH